MFSSPRFALPHLRARFIVISLGFIALLSFFAFDAQAQQLSGIRSPVEKKELAGQELSARARAARGQAPLNRLYEHIKVLPSKVRRLPALAEREVQDAGSEKRLRIGEVRAFQQPVKVSTDSTFYSVAEGDVRVLGVVTEGARYTRVHFTGMSLPTGARVFVYSLENPEEFYGPYEGSGPSGDGTFWTPPMEGEGVVIEYFTPDGADDSAAATPFQVSEVSHIFSDPLARAGANEKAAANSTAGACNLEVTTEWAEVAKSVGELQFTSGGGEYLCTGTLLNNQANNFTPYLLTANHCFSTQVEAQTLRVYWNYNSGDTPPGNTPRTDGATLLATGTTSDFTFVVLTGSLPGGLYFSGWDASTQISAATPVTGIHHPKGSHKRISFGATNSNCVSGLPGPCSNYTGVTWNSGTTEGGSSGSGIWTGSAASPQLVGTLTGGEASCATPALSDYYGRFSVTYPRIAPFLTTATGTSCVSAITPSSQYFSTSGGAGSINVTAPAECNWNVAASHSFVNITSGPGGSGNGTVTFSVAPNGGGYRAAVIMVGTRVFTVTQADASNPLPGVSINDVSYNEGDFDSSNATVTVSLSAPSSKSVSVQLRASANTAQDGGVDFYPASTGSLTFSPGETTKTFTIPIIGDTKIEPDETFFIDLTGATNAVIGKFRATFTIVNDDVVPTVSLSINDVSVTEGNTSTTPATFTVTLSAPTAKTVKVTYGSAMVTAGVGDDFQLPGGTITFTPGQTTQTITVHVNGDTVAEGNETFKIVLRDPANALLADAEGVCTIIDDEAAPTLSIDNITIVEGNSGQKTAIFTVSLSTKTNQQVSVSYTTSPGTATENKDYMRSWGAILFGPQGTTTTISVNINGDIEYEGDETFFMTLSDPSGATISKAQGVCTITNDDVPQLPLKLILEESGPTPNSVLALEAWLLFRDPFPITSAVNTFNQETTDPTNTRVIVFVTNLQLVQGHGPAVAIINLVDSNNRIWNIASEDVRPVPLFNFTQVRFKLPSGLAPGTGTMKVTAYGQETNSGTIRFRN